jgi:hypothetical protein
MDYMYVMPSVLWLCMQRLRPEKRRSNLKPKNQRRRAGAASVDGEKEEQGLISLNAVLLITKFTVPLSQATSTFSLLQLLTDIC